MLNKQNFNLKISVVVPAYNEEGKIGRVIKKIKERANYINEIIVVNDGSKDNTEQEARFEGATVINHETNKGVGAALRTGYSYCLKNNFGIIVTMGGDDQDDPLNIKDLITPLVEGDFDIIQGSRYKIKAKLNQPWFRYFTTKIYSFVFSFAAMKRVTDSSNGFRAFKSEILKKIDLNKGWLDEYELEPYLLLEAIKNGFKFKEIGVFKYWPKGESYSKMMPFKSWWSISRPMIYKLLGVRR